MLDSMINYDSIKKETKLIIFYVIKLSNLR